MPDPKSVITRTVIENAMKTNTVEIYTPADRNVLYKKYFRMMNQVYAAMAQSEIDELRKSSTGRLAKGGLSALFGVTMGGGVLISAFVRQDMLMGYAGVSCMAIFSANAYTDLKYYHRKHILSTALQRQEAAQRKIDRLFPDTVWREASDDALIRHNPRTGLLSRGCLMPHAP
jgi:hypothetical protein